MTPQFWTAPQSSGGALVLPAAVSSSGDTLFQSDFSTALGSGDAAVRDTNKTRPWTDARNNADMESISTSGLDMPAGMANCLRVHKGAAVTAPEVAVGDFSQATSGVVDLAVGGTRNYRIYLRSDIADAEGVVNGAAHHPIQQGPFTTFNWHFGNRGDGRFPLLFYWDESGSVSTVWSVGTSNAHSFGTPPLLKFQTYRLEWALTRVTTLTFTISVWIYDSANNLVSDDGTGQTNMVRNDGSGALLKNYNAVTDATRAGKMPYFRTGSNGGPTYTTDQYYYLGGVMIRDNARCGAYT